MKRIFITGTDTGIGKTYVACRLISHLVSQGHAVSALKPVASGCDSTHEGLRNEDALALMDVMNVDLAYEQVNPYAFEPAIAPHIAAKQANRRVNLTKISEIADAIDTDFLIIEGAGGWCVPIDQDLLMADLVDALKAEVILVVGMKLGCINHALLSARQIQADGFQLTGWVANCVEPAMPVLDENMATLASLMPVPLLATVPFNGKELMIEGTKLVFYNK
jgi:dethiobiotin synthetase